MAFWPAAQFGIFMTIAGIFTLFLGWPIFWPLGLLVAGAVGFVLGFTIRTEMLK